MNDHGDEPFLDAARAERDALLADDDRYDDVMARCDEGRECPACHETRINRIKALGIPMFECNACGTPWLDLTRPDTSTRDLFLEA